MWFWDIYIIWRYFFKRKLIFFYNLWFEYYLEGMFKVFNIGFVFCKIKLVLNILFFYKFNRLKWIKVKLDLRELLLIFVFNGVFSISFVFFEIYVIFL